MKLQKLTILLATLSLILFSCEETTTEVETIAEGQPSTTPATPTTSTTLSDSCLELDFQIEATLQQDRILLDVTSPSDPLEKGYSYDWELTTTTPEGVSTVNTDFATEVKDDSSYSVVAIVGSNKICLNSSSESCPEGKEVCKTFVLSAEQYDNIIALYNDKEELPVSLTPEGNFTVLAEAKSNCKTVETGLRVGATFTEKTLIGNYYASLPSELGLEDDEITYLWSTKKFVDDVLVSSEDSPVGGDNAGGFIIDSAGTYEFCLKSTQVGCTDSVTDCNKLVIDETQFTDAITDEENIEKIEVITLASGEFSINVIRKK